MFDVGASELLLIVIVAIVVIGPKDLPLALRTAGRWIGKVRRVSAHFRSGLDTMIREAELDEMEKKWREQNAAILAAHPNSPPEASAESAVSALPAEIAATPADATLASPQEDVPPPSSQPPQP
jgi:sec-independent protein translocase protein TatB